MKQLELISIGDESGATFSPCRTYRYRLWRTLSGDIGTACWIMLNPSTADEIQLDPTVRRCIGFTRVWGLGRLEVVNLFALCSTNPRALYKSDEPIGADNDQVIFDTASAATIVIAAWGAHGCYCDRGYVVTHLLKHLRLVAFGTTKNGQPRHPLYIRADTVPIAWVAKKMRHNETRPTRHGKER